MTAAPLMTIKQYAEHRGVCEGAVRRALRDGRITKMEGGIHPDAADAEWSRNTRPKRPTGKAATKRAEAVAAGEAVPPGGGDALYRVRLEREQTEAKLKALDLAERERELIEAAAAVRAIKTIMVAARDAVMVIPRRCAALCAAQSDAREVQTLLEREARAALEQMARSLEKLAQSWTTDSAAEAVRDR